jgi:dTDP-4-amino-4,6-dideoxygalactose transaminase
MMNVVRFLDLSVPEATRRLYVDAIERILATGIILNGPEVETFERQLADYCGTEHAVGVGSGTCALYLALRCLRIGPGDDVIVPALSFVGTANAIATVGARPVFVDVLSDMLVDPAAIEAAISSRTRAIMPVHFTGNVCEMDALVKISERHGIPIVEDAAAAFGASYRGRKAGTFGPLGCFSMNPMKILGAIGEAGAVVVQSDSLLPRLRDLRYHGVQNKDICVDVSLNARLDTIQASILSMRLREIEGTLRRRQSIAERYAAHLFNSVHVPKPAAHIRHAWYTYTILCDRRDDLARELESAQIECRVQHPRLMPAHPPHAGDLQQFPMGQSLVKRLLCIPMHEKLTDAQVDRVAETIVRFYGNGRAA